MIKKKILSVILIAASVGLAVLAYIILPETVVTQISIGSAGNTAVAKPIAILIPTALGIGGAVASLFSGDEKKSFGKSILVSAVGIGLCIITIAVNSLIK